MTKPLWKIRGRTRVPTCNRWITSPMHSLLHYQGRTWCNAQPSELAGPEMMQGRAFCASRARHEATHSLPPYQDWTWCNGQPSELEGPDMMQRTAFCASRARHEATHSLLPYQNRTWCNAQPSVLAEPDILFKGTNQGQSERYSTVYI